MGIVDYLPSTADLAPPPSPFRGGLPGLEWLLFTGRRDRRPRTQTVVQSLARLLHGKSACLTGSQIRHSDGLGGSLGISSLRPTGVAIGCSLQNKRTLWEIEDEIR